MSLSLAAAARLRGLLAVCLLGLSVTSLNAATLDSAAQARVRAATFEVVMKKPEKDSLKYERPLPLELLPYTERTDKYASVGTAFAIGGNRYVTAAHVISLGFLTQFGEPALRGSDGVVHEIAEVLKFNERQDFAVLSLRQPLDGPAFDVNLAPKLDEAVFAVGNALGEGIVVRDGLFTSETPEQRDGKWKWIRFSAAASPGNSGGPLLDKDGRVIGVVLQKSPNENLNYAAPISVVLQASDGLGRFDRDTAYWLPVMTTKETGRLDVNIKLPLPFPEFARAANAAEDAHYESLRSELLRKNADSIFPKGPGSQIALHSNYTNDMLTIAGRKDDGAWEYYFPQSPSVTQLGDNGYVAAAQMMSVHVLKIRRPDSTPPKEFYSDSEAYIATILKALPWKRQVGPEEVRIISMGPAKEESQYVDPYGRKWQLRIWNVEHEDSLAMSMALPTPDGYLAMLQWVGPRDKQDELNDMRTLATFAHVAFMGSLKQWDEYLALKDLHPRSFEQIRIEREYGKSFSYRSPRVELSYTESQMKISPETQLRLGFGYYMDGDAPVWDVAMIGISEDLARRQGFFVSRHSKPPASLPQDFSVLWQKISGREFPFSAEVFENNGFSMMNTIYPYPAAEGASAPTRFAYQIGYLRPGKHPDEEMREKLTEFAKRVRVVEE